MYPLLTMFKCWLRNPRKVIVVMAALSMVIGFVILTLSNEFDFPGTLYEGTVKMPLWHKSERYKESTDFDQKHVLKKPVLQRRPSPTKGGPKGLQAPYVIKSPKIHFAPIPAVKSNHVIHDSSLFHKNGDKQRAHPPARAPAPNKVPLKASPKMGQPILNKKNAVVSSDKMATKKVRITNPKILARLIAQKKKAGRPTLATYNANMKKVGQSPLNLNSANDKVKPNLVNVKPHIASATTPRKMSTNVKSQSPASVKETAPHAPNAHAQLKPRVISQSLKGNKLIRVISNTKTEEALAIKGGSGINSANKNPHVRIQMKGAKGDIRPINSNLVIGVAKGAKGSIIAPSFIKGEKGMIQIKDSKGSIVPAIGVAKGADVNIVPVIGIPKGAKGNIIAPSFIKGEKGSIQIKGAKGNIVPAIGVAKGAKGSIVSAIGIPKGAKGNIIVPSFIKGEKGMIQIKGAKGNIVPVTGVAKGAKLNIVPAIGVAKGAKGNIAPVIGVAQGAKGNIDPVIGVPKGAKGNIVPAIGVAKGAKGNIVPAIGVAKGAKGSIVPVIGVAKGAKGNIVPAIGVAKGAKGNIIPVIGNVKGPNGIIAPTKGAKGSFLPSKGMSKGARGSIMKGEKGIIIQAKKPVHVVHDFKGERGDTVIKAKGVNLLTPNTKAGAGKPKPTAKSDKLIKVDISKIKNPKILARLMKYKKKLEKMN